MLEISVCPYVHQLERLNAEAAARTKRERRRANEVKTRTIQRMQLQMTAPLDIGLEQSDAALGLGQEDVFDLDDAERRMHRKGTAGVAEVIGADDDGGSSSDERDEESPDEDEGVLDEDELREKKTEALEAEMDGMYNAYRTRLTERSAKFKVQEARRKNKEREEWGGIRNKGSDEEGEDEENDEDGGWDKVAEAKAKEDDETSSDDSDEEAPVSGRKRRREDGDDASSPKSRKHAKLVTKLEEPKDKSAIQTSRAAQVWFGRDVFMGMDDLDDIEDDAQDVADASADDESDQHSSLADSEVSMLSTVCWPALLTVRATGCQRRRV